MARVLFVFGLLCVCQLIRANAEPTYFTNDCQNRSGGTVADLEERNMWLTEFIYNISYATPRFYNITGGDIPNKVYVLFQCREDLSLDICWDCIAYAKTKVLEVCSLYNEAVVWYEECMVRYAYRNYCECNTSTYVEVFYPSCQLRFDNESFTAGGRLLDPFGTTSVPPVDQGHAGPPISALPTTPTSKEKKSLKPGIIIGIASASSIGILLLVACLFLCLRRTRPEESFPQSIESSHVTNVSHDVVGDAMDDIRNLESLQFDFMGVQAATNNFSKENKLGQGGFGEVYKGEFSNGEEIAVKRLSRNSQQGAIEFKNEVLLLAKLQHRNLVKLLGFCTSGDEKILIYEFLSNLSLDHFLYDQLKRVSLEWQLRYKIITGIARGLLYLHEDSRLKIIHRDLKASNILLDEAMNAKIADFGIARLFNLDQTQGDTMRIAGTYGYMAPEYALAGHFSVKSDVYSFGVIVLEIVSGQRNSFFNQQQDEGLVYRVWRLWNEDAILELVDPLLRYNFSEEEAKLCIQIGLLCIQEDATHRPRMASIVAALNGQAITLPMPNAPHFFAIGTATDTTTSNFNSLPENKGQQKQSDDGYTGPVTVTDIGPR